MKKLIIIVTVLITGFITSIKSETKSHYQSEFEFGFFYSNLSPYGSWIEIDAGLVVWKPTIVRRGWAPYRHGQWIWTVDGWYWDSYEPFGYIVFHYGRWYYDDYYGWIWVPDYDWAPAWVEWRYDDDYIGWAPLPPYAVFSINTGIYYTNNYYVPYNNWHYVKYKYFCDPYVDNYYVGSKYKYRIHNRTKYRDNYDYRNGRIVNRGVEIDFVRKRSGQDIRVRDIVRVNNVKEVEKYRGKNDDVVRTFVASREQITKTRSNDVKIEKKNKRTTLDVSKVRLGREDNNQIKVEKNQKERSAGRNMEIKKNTDSRNDVIKKERNNNSDVKRKNEVEIKRNETIKKEQKKNNEFIPEKKVERKDVQKKQVERNDIQKKNIEQRDVQKNKVNIQRNTEVKRNIETKKKNNDFIPEKKVERKNVQKTEVKRNTEVNRKVEVKKENTNRNNTVFEQQKRENKTQVKTEIKRNDNTVRTKTQVERKNNSGNNKNKNR